MSDGQISEYPVAPPPTAEETIGVTTSEAPVSSTSGSDPSVTASTAPSSTSLSFSSPREDPPPSYPHFDLQKLFDITKKPWDQLAGYPFQELCQPSGDCAVECRDSARLYEGRPSDVVEHNGMKITLFETCSNLGYLTLYDASVGAVSASVNASDRTLLQISADIGGCLASACETSRKPWECSSSCSVGQIYGGSVGTHSSSMTWHCLSALCSNTCGMPYMDADVMGVGVRSPSS